MPLLRAAYPVVKAVQAAAGEALRFVFRNFPLAEAHEHATMAAQAEAEAAGVQGENFFWKMHDRLYEHQYALDTPSLIKHAKEIGLDAAQFQRDLEAGTFLARVKGDFRGGVRSGVNGTPTFFINGERYDGEYDAESLIAAIRQTAP